MMSGVKVLFLAVLFTGLVTLQVSPFLSASVFSSVKRGEKYG